jgi:nucleoid DNA-binding protein
MHPFARAVAAQTGLSEEQALACVWAFLDEVVDTLVQEGRTQIDHFGVFELKTRAARKGRNPRTGERVEVPEKVSVSFRPAQALRRMLDHLSQEKGTPGGPGDRFGKEGPKKHWWEFWR